MKGSDEPFDVILVASGSEVSTCLDGAELLRRDGVKVRVVSAPSEGLFRRQSREYQEQVLPEDARIFGLTAGLPVTLEGLVGAHGKVYGSTASASPLLTRCSTRNWASPPRMCTGK